MLIYCFDEATKKFAYTDVIDDSEQVPENATTIAPVNSDGTGMYAPTWNGTNWVPMSQEEFNKQNPPTPPEDWQPSQDDQQDAQTMLLIANLTQQIQEQQKLNAQMMLQIADLTQKVQQ